MAISVHTVGGLRDLLELDPVKPDVFLGGARPRLGPCMGRPGGRSGAACVLTLTVSSEFRAHSLLNADLVRPGIELKQPVLFEGWSVCATAGRSPPAR